MHFIKFIALLAPFVLASPYPEDLADADLQLQRRQLYGYHSPPSIYTYGRLVRRSIRSIPIESPPYYAGTTNAASPLVRRSGIGTAYSAVRYPSYSYDNRHRNRRHRQHNYYHSGYLVRRSTEGFPAYGGLRTSASPLERRTGLLHPSIPPRIPAVYVSVNGASPLLRRSGIGTAYSAVRYPSYGYDNRHRNRHHRQHNYYHGGYLVRRTGLLHTPPLPQTPTVYGGSTSASSSLVRRSGIGTAYSAVRYPSYGYDNRHRNRHHRQHRGYQLVRRQCHAYRDSYGNVHESGCNDPPTCSYDSNGNLIGCVA